MTYNIDHKLLMTAIILTSVTIAFLVIGDLPAFLGLVPLALLSYTFYTTVKGYQAQLATEHQTAIVNQAKLTVLTEAQYIKEQEMNFWATNTEGCTIQLGSDFKMLNCNKNMVNWLEQNGVDQLLINETFEMIMDEIVYEILINELDTSGQSVRVRKDFNTFGQHLRMNQINITPIMNTNGTIEKYFAKLQTESINAKVKNQRLKLTA